MDQQNQSKLFDFSDIEKEPIPVKSRTSDKLYYPDIRPGHESCQCRIFKERGIWCTHIYERKWKESKRKFDYLTSPDTVLDVTLKKAGFLPEDITAEIQKSNFGVWFDPLYKDTRWDLSFYMSLPQLYIGAQYRYFFLPNRNK